MSQKGQGVIEYAVLLAFIVAVAAVLLGRGDGLRESITSIISSVAVLFP